MKKGGNKKSKKREATLEIVAKSIDDLAQLTAKGFSEVDRNFSELKAEIAKKTDDLEARLGQRIIGVQNTIDNIVLCIGSDVRN